MVSMRGGKMNILLLVSVVCKLYGVEFSGGSATDTDLLIGSGQFIDGFEISQSHKVSFNVTAFVTCSS